VALGAALPFARRDDYSGTFLITAALFGTFAIPAFLFLPADRPVRLSLRQAIGAAFAETRATLRGILAMPALRRFLLAYLFFEDGINTVVYFSSVFAGHTLGFTTPEVIQLYFVVQLAAVVGAWAWARPTDMRGPKFVVMVTLVQWCAVVVAAYFVETKAQFFAVAVVAGTALGAAQAAGRAFMAALIRQDRGDPRTTRVRPHLPPDRWQPAHRHRVRRSILRDRPHPHPRRRRRRPGRTACRALLDRNNAFLTRTRRPDFARDSRREASHTGPNEEPTERTRLYARSATTENEVWRRLSDRR